MAPDPQANQSIRELTEEFDPLLSPAVVGRDVTGGYESCSSIGSGDSAYVGLPSALKVYRRRWWILLVFSYLSFCQSLIWITWNSIALSAKQVYNWSDGILALLANWGNIPFVILMYPVCWLLETKGLKVAALLSASLMLIGTALRCITSEPYQATMLIHAAQIANGVAGVFTLGAASMLSAAWFPLSQRTTATSIVLLFNCMGIAVGFFLGPFIVHNEATISSSNLSIASNCSSDPLPLPDDIERQRNEIMHLLNIELVLAMVGFVCTVIYFPRRPPLPPSASASVEKTHFKSMIWGLFRNRQFWVIGLGYAVGNAVASNWLGVLETVLTPLGISQKEAGNLGAYCVIAGCIASLTMASLVDAFGGHIKLFLITLCVVGTSTYIWYTLMSFGVLPAHKAFLYVCTIVAGFLAYSTGSLYMELLAEVLYPTPEGIVGVCLMAVTNIFGVTFLGLFLVPNIGLAWVNWCLIASGVICTFLACIQDETYKRSTVDKSLANFGADTTEET